MLIGEEFVKSQVGPAILKPYPHLKPITIDPSVRHPSPPNRSEPASPWPSLPASLSDAMEVVPKPTMTNHERFDLVSKLLEQPLKNGDVWFAIPQLWFDDWKKACEEKPDDTETSIGPVSTSILIGKRGEMANSQNYLDILYTERAIMQYDGGYNLAPAYYQSLCSNSQRKLIPNAAWSHLLEW